MSFPEEPESQIDFPLLQYTNEQDSPPPPDCGAHGYAHQEPSPARNSDEPGSDDTILDGNTALISSPISQPEVLDSQMKETQLVPLEHDTQPSIGYDISPITQRVLDNTESSSASLPPPMMAMQLLERRDTPALSDTPEFRFGKPPKTDSMKLTRPLPGPNRPRPKEMTDRERLVLPKSSLHATDRDASSDTIGTLSSRGDPSNGIFAFEEQPNSTLPPTQTEPARLPDQKTAQDSEDAEVGNSRSFHQTIEHVSGARRITEEALPRSSRRPFEEASESMNTTMQAQLLATVGSHSMANRHSRSTNQPRRQAKSKSPPFIEAVLSSNLRPNADGIPTAAITPGSALCARNGLDDPTTAEIQSSKPDRLGSSSVAEPTGNGDFQESLRPRNHPNHPGDAVHTLSDVTAHEKLDHEGMLPPTFFDRDLPEPSHVLRDLPSNHGPRSRNRNANSYTSRHGTNKQPPSNPHSRPLAEYQLQPQDIRGNQDLHSTRDSRVLKRGLSRAKSAHQMQCDGRIPTGGSEPINSEQMCHMAAVMATAEREQREQVVAKARLQEVQIVDLSKENAELQNRNEILSTENRELLDKHAEFRTRCEKYKTNMNEITRVQKELYAAAKVLDQRKFHALKKAAKEMDAELLEAKALASEESRAILKEARLKLDRQDKMVELLNRDINNRLLDLQRERGLKESLQKQLENREKQQEELKAVLFDHQQSTIAILSGHEDLLRGVLSAGADSALRLNECRALIKSLEESEPKPIPALIELNELVVALSTSVGKKFQRAEDGSIQVRDAGVEVLAELKNRLRMLSEDHSAQRNLNATITDLREENVTLKERLQSRDAEFSRIERQFNDIKQELQECRTQLTGTTDDLSKAIAASREDAFLRTQLQDLQTSYSIAKDQAESSANEMERIREDLHEQGKITLLAHQDISKLQDELRRSEAKASAFDVQKEAYVRQLKDESYILRLQMERDVRARLAEDEARYNDNVSGLRRQITEANNNLSQTERKLHDVERVSSSKEAETQRLSTQVSAIATELGSFQDKARLMEQNRDQTGSELRVLQEQLIQYMDKAAEWSSRAEKNALEFAKRCKYIDEGLKRSGKVAELEVGRLQALVVMLQKKNEDSEIVNGKVSHYLRSMGLLKAGLTLEEWVIGLPGEHSQQETNLDPLQPSAIGELCNVTALSPGSYCRSSGDKFGASTVSNGNKQMSVVVPGGISVQLVGEYTSRTANPSYGQLDEDRMGLSENGSSRLPSYSISSSNSMSRDTSGLENHLSTRSMELTGESGALSNACQPFPTTEAIPRSNLRTSDYFDGSNVRPSGMKKLEGTARTVIPDSQEELTQEQIPAFARPTRRVAERRHSTPHLRAGKRTVTRTEFTEYSIRTSEMYDDTTTLQYDLKDTVRFSDQATNLKSVDSDLESSGLSEPPDDVETVDFTECLDDSDVTDRKGPEILRISNKKAYAQSMVSRPRPSPKPNSSRVRTRPPVQTKEIKPPKGILKRTNNAIRNDASADTRPNGSPLKNIQPSKVQATHRGSAVKRRLSSKTSGTNRIDGATYGSPYNRIVSGNRATQNGTYVQAPDGLPQGQRPPAADIFDISSSPAMGQPQRNSKKRVLSGVGFNDSNRPSKFQRPARH